MKTNFLLKATVFSFVVIALALATVQPGLAGSPAVKTIDGGTNVYDPATGALVFVNADQGIASPLGAAAMTESAAQNATAFVTAYADKLGLSNPAADLALAQTRATANNRLVTRFHQVYRGIPVFATDVIVNTNAQGQMLSLSAKTSPNLQVDTKPSLTAQNASADALNAIASNYHIPATDLAASAPELQIYDSRLLNPDGMPTRLVWKLVISSQTNPISEVALVDAQDGSIVLHYSQIDVIDSPSGQAMNSGSGDNLALVSAHPHQPGVIPTLLGAPMLSVYDLAETAPNTSSGTWNDPLTLKCDQATPSACDSDTDAHNAYRNALDFYNFFATHHGRDSIDGAGATINSHVHYGGIGAVSSTLFWLGTPTNSIVYKDGYAAAEDLAGHAMVFGVTQDESNLVLYAQSGAISQSLGDMWGEFVEEINSPPSHPKWLIGEDSPGGTVRNMQNPTLLSDPDKITSSFYVTDPSDKEGMRTNAGINNKAIYLMTDGGVFNGQTVTGIGMEKVADIYYEAETNLLVSASTYYDLYYAVNQACANLIGVDSGNGAGAITASNCAQVNKALLAVEMNKAAVNSPVATYCPTDTKGHDLFFDGFETDPTAQWTFSNTSSADQWAVSTSQSPEGVSHLHGPEPSQISNAIAQMKNQLHLPAGRTTYLYFRQRMGLETNAAATVYYDGGVLQYSLDNGAWKDAAPLFSAGQGYGGTLNNTRGNPLGGKPAFVGLRGDYVPSRYNLTTLAGHNVKFRWILGADNQVGEPEGKKGWDLDAIRVYNCVKSTSKPTLTSPANGVVLTTYKPLLDWSDSKPDLDYYKVQVSLNSSFTSLVINNPQVLVSNYTIPSALAPNRKYYWRVSAYNPADQTLGWTTARSFGTKLATPVLTVPSNRAVLKTNRPAFDWSDSVNATGYIIQLSLSNTFSPLLLTGRTTSSNYTPNVDLPRVKRIYWRVQATGAYPSAWSGVRFFISGNSPSTPNPVSPANNALVSLNPVLKWSKATLGSGAFNHYLVQVDDNSDFSSPLINQSITNINTLSFTVNPALSAATTYYWRVQAWGSGANFSGWSAVRSMHTN